MLDVNPWLNPWLEPLAGTNPSGGSLRDHPMLDEIERMMKPRVDVTRNDMNRPTGTIEIPVDWAGVLARCQELRPIGRDLRLLVIVARAHANERGFAGLADGLTLIARTIELHWETLFPELRDSSDPATAAFRRLNVIAGLQGEASPLADLRDRTIFTVRTIGAVKGSELERAMMDSAAVLAGMEGISDATRAIETEKQEQLILKVRAACTALAKQAPDQMADETAGARAALAAAEAVEAALAARVGQGTRLAKLTDFLRGVAAALSRGTPTDVAPEPSADLEASVDDSSETAAPTATPAAPTRISSREDVIKALDRIIEFYDRAEPSSPVPFLAQRMRRMVPMNFMELMEDLAPGGVKEFRTLAGISEDVKKSRS